MDELENTPILAQKIFTKQDVKRGSSRGNSKSFFKSLFVADREDEDGQVTTEQIVGFFKGRIAVYNEEKKKEFDENKEDRIAEIFKCI